MNRKTVGSKKSQGKQLDRTRHSGVYGSIFIFPNQNLNKMKNRYKLHVIFARDPFSSKRDRKIYEFKIIKDAQKNMSKLWNNTVDVIVLVDSVIQDNDTEDDGIIAYKAEKDFTFVSDLNKFVKD